MTSSAKSTRAAEVDYPTSDGKPMAETEVHLLNMFETIGALAEYFQERQDVYVAGNMLMYYVPGNKRKHVSPDVFVVRDLDKHLRPNYLVWQEGKAPDLVIELTSSSTRKQDTDRKFRLYRDVLKVKEYFLFDPTGDYLTPTLQGYRLFGGQYAQIRPVGGRLPSKILGLHLESNGIWLRVYDPAACAWLPTRKEVAGSAIKKGLEHGLKQGIEQGIRQGLEQGIKQGIEQGIKQGIEQGIEQGLALGELEGKRSLLKDLLTLRFGPLSTINQNKLTQLSLQALADLGTGVMTAATIEELGFEKQ